MKHNRFTRFLAATLALAALMVASPASPALAAEAINLGAVKGSIGQQITISGSGFVTSSTPRGVNILFGEAPAAVGDKMDYANAVYQKVHVVELSGDGTFSTRFTVPATLGSGTTVKNVSGGNYYISATYFYPGPPSVDGPNIVAIAAVPFTVVAGEVTISPDNGTAGTEVTINGEFFGNAEQITAAYDGIAISDSDGALTQTRADGTFGPATITIPPSPGGQHFITLSGGTSGLSTQVAFTVKPQLSISPTSGAAGQLITATGSGFGTQADIGVSFAGVVLTPARADINGGFSTVLVALPRAAGAYDVVFSDGVGNSVKANFTLTATSFSVSPVSGMVGSSANVSGSKFLSSRLITVTIDGTTVASVTSTEAGAFDVAFAVPALPSGTYEIRASDGTNDNTAQFTVVSSLVISPGTTPGAPGHAGSEVTVSGVGFDAGATVTVSYDDATVATASAAGDKTYSVTFKVPASKAGEHTITVSSGTIVERATFIMESSPPPSPSPLKPEMGIEAGASPVFDWQDVTDPSGLTYTLQVATAPDFSTGSVVLEKREMTESQYAIAEGEALEDRSKDSPYYWRVRAIDSAGNQSLWSGTGVFYIGGGGLPRPVVYFLVGLGALALITFAFWLGKRAAYA